MVDMRTKGIKLEAANITITAMGTAVIMRDCIYWEEGLSAKVYSDRGPQFVGGFMKELYKLVGIEGNPSMAYHPQMDRQMEWMNHEVEKYLHIFTNHQQDDWVDWLPLAEFAYNNMVNEATGTTPFYLNKGHHLRMFSTDPIVNTPAEAYIKEVRTVAKKAEVSLTKAKAMMKRKWDKGRKMAEEYAEGDLVLLLSDCLPSMRPSRKLDDKWRGPFRVFAKKGSSTYEIALPASWKGHRVFNKSRIKRYFPLVFDTQKTALAWPDPELQGDGTEEYEVKQVLDKRNMMRGVEYLMWWEGYGPKGDTWEKKQNLKNARGAIWDFEARGWATGRVGYHVTAITGLEHRMSGSVWQKGWTRLRPGLIPGSILMSGEDDHQSGTDGEDNHQSSTDGEDNHQSGAGGGAWYKKEEVRFGSGPQGPELMGKLCRRVLALIKWKVSHDRNITESTVQALESWLWVRGISIYTDCL
jgi:hypothetical protein